MKITIGRHYPVESPIHRLDARIKVTGVFLYVIAIFIAKGAAEYLFAACFTAVVIYMTNVPVKMFLSGFKNLAMVILFTAVLNVFFSNEGNVLWGVGIIKITDMGIITAARLTARLLLLVIGSSVLTLTTSPMELTYALESLLKPLKRVGVPVHETAMMISIAIRFIPTLSEELEKIKKAQSSRGVDFESGSFMQRAKNFIPLLVPLFISSFRRADELAMAMESRGYRGDEGRTRMRKYLLNVQDKRAGAVMAAFLVIIILMRILI
ncbi:MAG: energy-coupling factor transporter transmembrane protein EcfT [Firmicutes bacterium]|nr:energy-coupling factor transporter transmembrane protein EcfT [Bacillota bacterium]